jgi:hypothetical protein
MSAIKLNTHDTYILKCDYSLKEFYFKFRGYYIEDMPVFSLMPNDEYFPLNNSYVKKLKIKN